MADNFNIIAKNDIAANWTASNPVLLKGQQGYETDTGRSKYGDGSKTWTLLNYTSQLSPIAFNSVIFAGLPTPVTGSIVFVSDRGTAGKMAYSDGVNWRFFNDDSIVT